MNHRIKDPAVAFRVVFESIEAGFASNVDPWQLLSRLDDLDRHEQLGILPRKLIRARKRCLAAYERTFPELRDEMRRGNQSTPWRKELTYERCSSCRRLVTMPCVACQCEAAARHQ